MRHPFRRATTRQASATSPTANEPSLWPTQPRPRQWGRAAPIGRPAPVKLGTQERKRRQGRRREGGEARRLNEKERLGWQRERLRRAATGEALGHAEGRRRKKGGYGPRRPPKGNPTGPATLTPGQRPSAPTSSGQGTRNPANKDHTAEAGRTTRRPKRQPNHAPSMRSETRKDRATHHRDTLKEGVAKAQYRTEVSNTPCIYAATDALGSTLPPAASQQEKDRLLHSNRS